MIHTIGDSHSETPWYQQVKYIKDNFNLVKNIQWEDIIDKISVEFKNQTQKFLIKDLFTPPTFVLHTKYFPNSIQIAYNEVCASHNMKDMHMYISLGRGSHTFGRHKDEMDVLIVQAKGNVEYQFDNGSKYLLNEGDSLFIPVGVYHTPIVLSPRVTLSFSYK